MHTHTPYSWTGSHTLVGLGTNQTFSIPSSYEESCSLSYHSLAPETRGRENKQPFIINPQGPSLP